MSEILAKFVVGLCALWMFETMPLVHSVGTMVIVFAGAVYLEVME